MVNQRTVITALTAIFAFALLFATVSFAAPKPRQKSAAASEARAAAPAVLSIIPSQAEPGGAVTISGAGFGRSIAVFIGTSEVQARIVDEKKIEFTIPENLEPGIYALNLRRADGVAGRPYNLQILPPKPAIIALTPDSIDYCSQDTAREVTVSGHNFTEQSLLLFNGAAIKSRFVSPEAIVFTVPHISGGLHQVTIKNRPDISSTPFSLTVVTRPEISQIVTGNESVNFYELVISGKNFQQDSTLSVNGTRISTGSPRHGQQEQLIFQDCKTLVYKRYPYSPVKKDLRLQVINPDGEGSGVVNMFLP